MHHFGHFETELQLRYPELNLYVRNFADEGNTPAFHPHPGRGQQVSFEGGTKLLPEELQRNSGATGHFETPDQWLARHQIDTILAFYGSVSAFRGEKELPRFEKELDAYLKHLKSQKFNGESAPQIALVSPTAIQDVRDRLDAPDPQPLNATRKRYTETMRKVAEANGVLFIDAFDATSKWFATKEQMTIDGLQLTDKAYRKLAPFLADQAFGKKKIATPQLREKVEAAVAEKNWWWKSDFKIPNGVHVYGRRYKPFGPDNYPDELKKIRQITAIRDQNLWAVANGKAFDVAAADAKTLELPAIRTNYKPSKKNGSSEYLYGEEARSKLSVADGYKIELFADERQFPNLANPVQMSFDNKGRLWVACMPSYPHYRPGDPRPTDTLIILEDTDGDNKADKETVFAGDLHLPIGFEITPDGVYVSQSDSLVLLRDTDGDDKYDEKEVIYSGFDDHDTHHAIGAFTTDPSGAIYLSEGVFLHSNVETPYGTARGTNGGFFRFNPSTRHLERTAQLRIPNPWGTAFDKWGQPFFLHTSGASLNWMTPGTVKPRYGVNITASDNLIKEQAVRPTSGLEIVSSRHFPDEVQGDLLLNNNIGFLGTKQHKVEEDGTGYKLSYRQDLLKSSDGNFRPVDLEFAPDGSLYVIDWSNALIGHMQHNARDPYRDHVHGRVYRITYPDRPLLEPAKIAGAPIADLLELLKAHEDRTRYRVRRELRGRPAGKVLPALQSWVRKLDPKNSEYERYLAEAMWVSWGLNEIDPALVNQLLNAKSHQARSTAVRAIRYNMKKIPGARGMLVKAAGDEHGRVRLEALAAASWLGGSTAKQVLEKFAKHPIDGWMKTAYNHSKSIIEGSEIEEVPEGPKLVIPSHLTDEADQASYAIGHEVYHREAHCATCHQDSGKGLDPTYPPLAGSQWVTGDKERLIKLVLHGIAGEIEVNGKQYGKDMPPMTAFGELLDDDKELAGVINFVRNSWGNQAPLVSADDIAQVRKATKDRRDYWSAEELLKLHPMKRKPVITGNSLPNPAEAVGGSSGSFSVWGIVAGVGLLSLVLVAFKGKDHG